MNVALLPDVVHNAPILGISQHLKGVCVKKSEVYKVFGGRQAVAETLGLSVRTIEKWGDEVPKCRRQAVIDAAKAKMSAMQAQIDAWEKEKAP